jgi:pseudaminic acid synthase
MKNFKIDSKLVGEGAPVFIIAELSANHNQDFSIAQKTIRAMKKAGADAVKVQTYTADTLTIDSDQKYFKVKQGTVWDGKTLYKLYQQAYTPWDWQPKLKKLAEDLGMVFFSSPFDNQSVDFLAKMKVPAYKVASFEITDVNLISYIAKQAKPVIISTGVASGEDIKLATATCRKSGNEKIALLKCVSSYPADPSDMNLLTIPDMAKKFSCVVGLSDHSMGSEAAIASVALGAKIIEKHFIFDRKIGGPDCSFSLEPDEFTRMVDSIRLAERTLGEISYELTDKAKKSREFSRSLFITQDIKKGDKFSLENLRSIRPGFGLHPKYLNKVLGRRAVKNLKRGTPLSLNDAEGLK